MSAVRKPFIGNCICDRLPLRGQRLVAVAAARDLGHLLLAVIPADKVVPHAARVLQDDRFSLDRIFALVGVSAVLEPDIFDAVYDRGIDRLDCDVVGDDVILLPLAGVADFARHGRLGQSLVLDGELDLVDSLAVRDKGRGVAVDRPLRPKLDVLARRRVKRRHLLFARLVRRPADEGIARLGRRGKRDVVVLDRVRRGIGLCVECAVHIVVFDVVCVDRPRRSQRRIRGDVPRADADAFAVGQEHFVLGLPSAEGVAETRRHLKGEPLAERHLRRVDLVAARAVKGHLIAVGVPNGGQGHVADHLVRGKVPRLALMLPSAEGVALAARVLARRKLIFFDLLGRVRRAAAEIVCNGIDLAPPHDRLVLIAVGTGARNDLNVKDVVPLFKLHRRRRDHILARKIGRDLVLRIGADRQLLSERERSLRVGQLDAQCLAVHRHLAAVNDRAPRGVTRRHPLGIKRRVLGHGVHPEIPHRRQVRLAIPPHKRISGTLGRGRLGRKRAVKHTLTLHLSVAHRVKCHRIITLCHVLVEPLGIDGHVAGQFDRQKRFRSERLRPNIFVPIPAVEDIAVLGRIGRQCHSLFTVCVDRVIDLSVDNKLELELNLTCRKSERQKHRSHQNHCDRYTTFSSFHNALRVTFFGRFWVSNILFDTYFAVIL